jgi:hypothetical protein|tara:strand:- start:2200 stop:2457 length:258 start_codon:yes stop_codon:yes gene_type:complete
MHNVLRRAQYGLELARMVQAIVLWKAVTQQEGGALDGEALAPFRTTSVEHFAATLGRHARPKTMSAFALQITGLKCSFHLENLAA